MWGQRTAYARLAFSATAIEAVPCTVGQEQLENQNRDAVPRTGPGCSGTVKGRAAQLGGKVMNYTRRQFVDFEEEDTWMAANDACKWQSESGFLGDNISITRLVVGCLAFNVAGCITCGPMPGLWPQSNDSVLQRKTPSSLTTGYRFGTATSRRPGQASVPTKFAKCCLDSDWSSYART